MKNCFSIKFIELLFLILLIAFSPAIIEAQTIDNNKFIISEIIVKENNSVGKVELLDMMGLKVGDKLDSDVITKGIKSAFLKGLFTDIKVNAAVKDKNNVQLTIEVVEREIIESIAIVGLERLRRDKIRDLFELKEGMIFYENEATNATSKLVKQIEKLGFPDVQVTTDIAKKNGTNKVKIQLIITENSPLIIKQLVIPVDKRFIGKSLGINPGDIYNEKEVKDKIQALTIKFKEKGYFRFQIKYEYIKTSEQLELDVDKGDRLEIKFNGNDNISKSDLLKETLFTELESANDIIIKESIDKLIKLYHKKGYCNVEIGYDLTNINGIIHIVFNIKEGKRYKIS
ncbi:MAG: hypothetical protein HQK93_05440, partial [Nitrospirae bacterium]|nr:hypothetical protein [Nitrospirota bacterium]